MVKLNIIDVSKHQLKIDWRKVKPNIDGAILRVGYRGYVDGSIVIDPQFYSNYDGVRKNRINYGIYFFTQAKSYAEGQRERVFVINVLSALDYKPSYPIYCDTEYANTEHTGRADHIGVDERTAAVIGFCETLENAGYFVGVYRSTSWFKSKVNDNDLKRFTHWVADYRINKDGAHFCGYDGNYAIWQYSSVARIAGISTNVDVNICYVDFAPIIINGGFNGYVKQAETEIVPDPTEPAIDPIEIETPNDDEPPKETETETETFTDGFIRSLIKAILKYLINFFET